MTDYKFKGGIPDGKLWFQSSVDSVWDFSLGHRKHVMSLINDALASMPPQCEVGVMSDGRWNGLDMKELLDAGHRLTLIDDSAEGVTDAVASQLGDGERTKSMHIMAPTDISGVRARLKEPAAQVTTAEVVSTLNSYRVEELKNRFDVGVSLCLMGQIMSDVVEALGQRPDKFEEVIVAVRNRNVEALIDSVKPGGRVIFVFLVLSNQTLAGIDAVPSENLSAVISIALAKGNYFHGAHPALVHREFARQQVEMKRVTDVQLVKPWIWNVGVMHYAVTAVTATKI